MSLFVLDFEAYKGKDGEFVVKELSIVPVGGGRLRTWTLKPPYPWSALPKDVQATNRWIYHNKHGIHWNTGKCQNLPYILDMALPSDAVVYIKGLEKAKYISYLLGPRLVVELENIGCPKPSEIEGLTPGCSNHATLHCSRVKAAKYAAWCGQHLMDTL